MSEETQAPPKRKKPGRKPGDGSAYTPELASEICEGLAAGKSLRECASGKVAPATVLNWCEDIPAFAEQYARARKIGTDVRFDGLRGLAAEAMDQSPQNVQAIRLMVDTEKWSLSKLRPERYGDKVAVTGGDGGALRVAVVELPKMAGSVAEWAGKPDGEDDD